MKLEKISQKEIDKTVSNSQKIEGYKPASKEIQKKAKELMSKYQLDSSPIYIDVTDIPKNKLNIDDSELIHEVENNLLVKRTY